MPRYKNPQLQALYDNMLALAADKASELYWQGEPRGGAGHRAAFWDGFSGKFDFTGPKRSAHVIPGTMSAVCFMAGREFARRQKRAGAGANPGPGRLLQQSLHEGAAPLSSSASSTTPVACHRCKEGVLEPFERVETFRPPTGEVHVRLLAARCSSCSREAGLPSQLAENIKRREARRSAYGEHLLGEDIFALRRRYGLTQQSASKVFGKGKIAFSRYETESSFPDSSTTKLLKLAMRFPFVLKALADDAGVKVPLWDERCEN
jgi:HTH-type transcriptional regulator/antitoxin MqsA